MFQLLPLCSTPKVAMRDAYVGRWAHIYIPFYGNWYADGKTITYPNQVIPQNRSLAMSGTLKPDTFKKDCCDCGPEPQFLVV